MEAFLVILAIIFILCLGVTIHSRVKDKKEAAASGTCKYCGENQATKKMPKGDYACNSCYRKIAFQQATQIIQESKEESERLAEEKPVTIQVLYGTSGIYDSFTPLVSDYAGGWDVDITVSNNTSKTIKYVNVELIPYNTVGDIGYSPTVGAGVKTIKLTGPIHPHGKLKNMRVKKCWYDIQLSRVGVGNINVVYMDNTEKTFQQ